MNTRILYMYRDAGNNKVFGDVVVHGGFTESQVEWVRTLLARFPENGFLPAKIGLPELREEFVSGASYDPELDHDWHEWEGVEDTDVSPTLQLSVGQVLSRFKAVERNGWDKLDP